MPALRLGLAPAGQGGEWLWGLFPSGCRWTQGASGRDEDRLPGASLRPPSGRVLMEGPPLSWRCRCRCCPAAPVCSSPLCCPVASSPGGLGPL